MSAGTKKILVVDDEETLCEVLRFNLEEAGYAVDVACSAEEALGMDLPGYSLILLDIMMGDISGVRLAGMFKERKSTAGIPIIFCTARDSEDDMVAGLDLGADDYITKPYSIRNVLARVRSVLRRSEDGAAATAAEESGVIAYKGLEVDKSRMTCCVDGAPVTLPRKEFEILALFLGHLDRIYSREEILKSIWPEEVVVLDRVVDVNISRLRSKLGPYGANIKTRAGYGYGFFS